MADLQMYVYVCAATKKTQGAAEGNNIMYCVPSANPEKSKYVSTKKRKCFRWTPTCLL